jgi:hypothetical protein
MATVLNYAAYPIPTLSDGGSACGDWDGQAGRRDGSR